MKQAKILVMILMIVTNISVLAYAVAEEVALRILPKTPYTSSYNSLVRYKYDILVSNPSTMTFHVTGVYISSYGLNGLPITELTRSYSNEALKSLLSANVICIMSYDKLFDGVSPAGLLYSNGFSGPDTPKLDVINWEKDNTLPPNSILALIFPTEETAGISNAKSINISVSGITSDGRKIKIGGSVPPQPYTTTKEYQLPVKGRWYVYGSKSADPHRRSVIAEYKDAQLSLANPARFGLDFVMKDGNGAQYRLNGTSSEDYYCWNKLVYSVEGGTVIGVINDVPDNLYPDPMATPTDVSAGSETAGGNGVLIDHGDNVLSVYYHLKYGSVTVKMGEGVKKGRHIGNIGNSGSLMPHLHYHLMSDPSCYSAKNPPFGMGDSSWQTLPEGIPTIFKNFYSWDTKGKSYIPQGTIDTGMSVEQNLPPEPPVISIEVEGPDRLSATMELGKDVFNTNDGTKYGSPMHRLKNTGNVDVKVTMRYLTFTGLAPSQDSLTDHFQTAIGLAGGELATLPPPDNQNPEMVIRDNLGVDNANPLLIHYLAPTELTNPVSGMDVTYEIRAYPVFGETVDAQILS